MIGGGITGILCQSGRSCELAVVHVTHIRRKASRELVSQPQFELPIGESCAQVARAVGLATTSTVVQSIVAVILLDAAFAVIFQRLGI